MISTVILLPSADSFKKGCCQLQAKVCARITGEPLVQACPGKSVVRWTDRPAMTIAVDLGRKATKPTKLLKNINFIYNLFCCNYACYCVCMISLTSVSRYVTSASRYQRRSLMYIWGLISRNSTELAEAVPIASWRLRTHVIVKMRETLLTENIINYYLGERITKEKKRKESYFSAFHWVWNVV